MNDNYYNSEIVHIDFCFGAPKKYVLESHNHRGYWYITEIRGNSGTVWRKSVIGEWNRIAHKYQSAEEDEVVIKNGNLKKSLHNITAAGDVHIRLDKMLLQHMVKENKTEDPYNYWQKRDGQEDDYGYYDLPED